MGVVYIHILLKLVKKLHCFPKLRDLPRVYGSCGTLGGGNHFIEIDEDENGNKYLIIHSGSRNLGTQIAKIYQKMAIYSCKMAPTLFKQEIINNLKTQNKINEIDEQIANYNKSQEHKTKIIEDYCYLEGDEMLWYLEDVKIAQEFAVKNRQLIGQLILDFLDIHKCNSFETIHNYIDNNGIIRKGAIRANAGEQVIIPLNMKDGCIIALGKGNIDWNNSAPHGAGRILRRSEVRDVVSLEDYKTSMIGIYSNSISLSTIDESVFAYKPMQEIISAIKDCVDIISIIKPKYNFKAGQSEKN